MASLPPASTTTPSESTSDHSDSSNSYEFIFATPFQYSSGRAKLTNRTAAATHRSKSSNSSMLSPPHSCQNSSLLSTFSSSFLQPSFQFFPFSTNFASLTVPSLKSYFSSISTFLSTLFSSTLHLPHLPFLDCKNLFTILSSIVVFFQFSNFNLCFDKTLSKLFSRSPKSYKTARFNARFSFCDCFSSSPLCTVLSLSLVLQLIAFNLQQCPVHALFYQSKFILHSLTQKNNNRPKTLLFFSFSFSLNCVVFILFFSMAVFLSETLKTFVLPQYESFIEFCGQAIYRYRRSILFSFNFS